MVLKILHLEDNAMDAELIYEDLEKAGLSCDVTRVESKTEFTAALSKSNFDLIISDFSMPGYSGNDALIYVHEHFPDTPFIFVSGTVGEDYAIDSLLNGATDYVLKNKMSRLVPAVKRVIQESAEKNMRVKAESALSTSDRRFRALVENSLGGITVFDKDGMVTYRSPQNSIILGQENYLSSGGEVFDKVHPDDLSRLNAEIERLLTGNTDKLSTTFRYQHGDGSWRYLDATFSDLRNDPAVGGIVCNFLDVTDKREAEAALRQSQKMESLGTLAGGIAHDFNNILAIITGYSSFLMRKELDAEKFSQCVSSIQSAADRGVGLVRQLLMFSRKHESEFVPMKINDIVNEVFGLISETFPKVILSKLELAEHLPMIVADHVQVNQCLLNLCVNARDAMMDRNDDKPAGGTLVISTGTQARRVSSSETGLVRNFVSVSVGDTGTGMDDATRARIFEPFFTTKEEGKGTGIGLSTVFGVMKKHGGLIDVATELGVGTTFTLLFPVMTEQDHSSTNIPAETATAGGGTDKILVVEDEQTLRELLKDVLADKGYSVVTAGDGSEALTLASRHPDIAMIICDWGLPELDGIDVLQRLKETGSQMKMLIASGFVDPEDAKRIEKLRIDGLIQKPYKTNEVLTKIREVLERKSDA